MSCTKGKIEKPAKPVVYRTRHKKLKDLKAEDTTHGFVERIKQQSPISALESMQSQPAFCGVLSNDINDSIQMTTSNYRKVPRELQNRVRRGRAVLALQDAASTPTSSNRLTSPSDPPDRHLEFRRRRSYLLTENYRHAAWSHLKIDDTQEAEYEEEHVEEHLSGQDQDKVHFHYPLGVQINDYYQQICGASNQEDDVPFRAPVIPGYSYQAPAGPFPDASFSLSQSLPSLLTSPMLPWGVDVEDPTCIYSALYQD